MQQMTPAPRCHHHPGYHYTQGYRIYSPPRRLVPCGDPFVHVEPPSDTSSVQLIYDRATLDPGQIHLLTFGEPGDEPREGFRLCFLFFFLFLGSSSHKGLLMISGLESCCSTDRFPVFPYLRVYFCVSLLEKLAGSFEYFLWEDLEVDDWKIEELL